MSEMFDGPITANRNENSKNLTKREYAAIQIFAAFKVHEGLKYAVSGMKKAVIAADALFDELERKDD